MSAYQAWNRIRSIWRRPRHGDPRTFQGLAANGFSQVVTLAIQILSMPLFLSYWSIEQYGRWVLLSAIPVYLAYSDAGLSAVAMNKMTFLSARNCQAQANVVFQTAMMALAGVASALALLTILACVIASYWLNFNYGVPLTFLIAATLVNMSSGVLDGLFRSSDRYAFGTNLLTAARLLEWLGAIAGLGITNSMSGTAVGLFLGRVVASLVIARISATMAPAFTWGVASFSVHELKSLLSDSVKYLAFPAAFSLSLQGVILVVGATLGPAAVAIISAYRTLSRAINQAVGAIGHTVWPQLTQLFARNERATMLNRVRFWTVGCIGFAGACGLFLSVFGKSIIRIWSHGQIPYIPSLMLTFICIAVVSAAGHIYFICAMATSSFKRLPFVYLITSAVSLVVVAAIAQTGSLTAVSVPLLFAEIFILYMARKTTLAIVTTNAASV